MAEHDAWRNDPIVHLEKHLYPLPPRLMLWAAQGQDYDDATILELHAAAQALRDFQHAKLDPLAIQLSPTSRSIFAACADLLDALATETSAEGGARRSDVAFLAGPFVTRIEETMDALRIDFLTQIIDRQQTASKMSAIAAREVTSISRQIYFISINASVEAARVGDAGRGFAVIGEQIRSLSQDAAAALKRMSHPSDAAQ